MPRESNDPNKNFAKLDKRVDNIEKKINKIGFQLQRIENKVNHLMNFLEELLVHSEDNEEEEEYEDYDNDETWLMNDNDGFDYDHQTDSD